MSVIILENIRSAYNVGNIIRTADAFGWSVVIAGYTHSHTHPKVLKTSLGAEQSVSITQFFAEALEQPDGFMDRSPNRTAIDWALSYVRGMCHSIYALEITWTSQILSSFSPDKNIWLIVGNEIYGVTPETIAQCDGSLAIPMLGLKESLNVCNAAAVALYALTFPSH